MRGTLVVVCALAVAACSDGNASFKVRESIEQLQVTHATPGAELAVHDGSGRVLASGVADAQGSVVFRNLPPGSGYIVRTTAGSEWSRHLTVMSAASSQPPQSFYDHESIGPGFTYITTRDGTTLSAYVTLPGPIEKGPYPTVVTYSGYSPSKPGMPVGNFEYLWDSLPALCKPPHET